MKNEPEIIKQLRNEEQSQKKQKEETPEKQIDKKTDDIINIKNNLVESTHNGIIIADLDGHIKYANQSFLKMWGYTKEDEIIGEPIVKFWKTKEKYVELIDTLIDDKEWSGEISAERKNGECFNVFLSANLIQQKNKKPHYFTALFIENKNKQSGKQKESDNTFQSIFNASSDILFYLDINGKIVDINKSALEILKLDKNKTIGKQLNKIRGLALPVDIKTFLDSSCTADFHKLNDYENELTASDGKKYLFLFSIDLITEGSIIKGVVFKGSDVTQRQKAWADMVKSEEKYRVLAETSADGVFTTDELGRLTYVNPSLLKMLGKRKGQILATLFREYLSESSIYLFQQMFLEIRQKDKKMKNIELEIVHNDGFVIPIEVNIAPLKKENRFTGIECTVRDITERKKIEQELKKSERLKTEFMNIAAHELKSPVTPIKGYLELIISDKESDDKIKGWAKIGLRNAERLLALVNDILDVSRLDSDTMRFNMEKLDTVELLTDSAEDMAPAINEKNLQLITEIPKDLPPIIGDKNRLSQVLKNLLTNAVKCTNVGSITIRAEKKDKRLYIFVEDTGIGISSNELEKIFSKFYQAYTGDDRKSEGAGLGLFICREIINRHKGKLSVESQLGRGSTFIVQLPL